MRFPLLIILAGVSLVQAQEDSFEKLDANGDGRMEQSEVPEEYRAQFPVVDSDSDGFITREELARYLESKKVTPSLGGIELLKNVDYVGLGNPRQFLDVLVQEDRKVKKRPLIVFVHGGAWLGGEKENGSDIIQALARSGDYVAASINYRLTDQAVWPAQIHDCKAAIRFLRGHSDEYGIDVDHIGVMGLSAGGQLVSVLGTCDDPVMEGKLGSFSTMPSSVQCVVNFFGPTNFLTFYGKDVPVKEIRSRNVAMRLLGEQEEKIRENARTASPVTWVSKGDAPFLTAHGTEDDLVPFAQAVELDEVLKKAGVESHLIAMEGGGHGFLNAELNERIRRFLNLHLKGEPAEISSFPIKVR